MAIPSNEPVYTISEAARALGISIRSLILFEREGLILPYRTSLNRRLYSELELKNVRNIQSMINERGLNLSAVRYIYANIPCWLLKKDDDKNHSDCPAFSSRSKPCWATAKGCCDPATDCRDCPVYQLSGDIERIRDIIYHDILLT